MVWAASWDRVDVQVSSLEESYAELALTLTDCGIHWRAGLTPHKWQNLEEQAPHSTRAKQWSWP